MYIMPAMIVGAGIGVLLAVVKYIVEKRSLGKLQKYWDVEIGMTDHEMLSIMGEGYSRGILKNNRVKYEWRINAKSYGSSFKGVSVRSYTGVRKVTIYTRNGYVEEIKPYNI